MGRPNDAAQRFAALAALPPQDMDLAEGALLIAKHFDPGVDVPVELARLQAFASEVVPRLPASPTPLEAVNTLNEYLFDSLGFRGNGQDYYDPRNSLLHEVLRRRTGIPITLAVVYMAVGRRAAVPLVGVGMPGHFLVRHPGEPKLFIDPYHGGLLRTEEECAELLQHVSASAHWDRRFLDPVDTRSVLARMLRNLTAIWMQRDDTANAEASVHLLVTLEPDQSAHRRDRGLLRYKRGNLYGAREDLVAYLARTPTGPDVERVARLVAELHLPDTSVGA